MPLTGESSGMSSEPDAVAEGREVGEPGLLEMPRPTIAPMVLALGMALIAAGVALSPGFLVVGGAIFVLGLGLWIGQLLPGRGHVVEPVVEPGRRARPIEGRAGSVERLQEGMAGYRLRLPERVHPISAGLKGGIVGGLLMPLPALAYGLASG